MGVRPSVLAAILRQFAIPPVPVTVNFTSAQVSPGFTGPTDKTRDATRIYGSVLQTAWMGIVNGSSATLVASPDNPQAGEIECSVDGVAIAAASLSAGKYTLFTGLSDGPHFVFWRYNNAYATFGYVPASGNVMAVNGVSPSIQFGSLQPQIDDGTTGVLFDAALATYPSGYLPAKGPAGTGSTFGANTPAIQLRGTYSEIQIASTQTYLFVSVDGAAPAIYNTGYSSGNVAPFRLSGLSGAHTYNVWGDGKPASGGVASVFGFSAVGTAVALTSPKRLDQYGDSITFGALATSPGHVDIGPIAAYFGYLGGNYGKSGDTIAQLLARLPATLAAKTISATDVAVLAIGRNDIGAAFTTQQISDFNSILTALRNVYGKVLVRGILPEASNTWPAENGSIQSIVTSRSDANVIFINTSAWSGIARGDGTHPTDAGYVTMVGYEKTAYAPYL